MCKDNAFKEKPETVISNNCGKTSFELVGMLLTRIQNGYFNLVLTNFLSLPALFQ